MKIYNYYILQAILLVYLCLLSTSFVYAETLFVVNSSSRTLSKIDTHTDVVINNFATLGNVPNKIVLDGNYLWSVNSGDNSLQKIDRQSGTTIANILVANSSNPWDAVLHGENLYVSGLFSGKVYRVNAQSGSVTGWVTVGTAPEALCVSGDKLYVSNAGNYSQDYTGSSVSVIDLPSFSLLATIPVNKNPQYLTLHNGLLHVSCTGNWADIGGSICVIDTNTDVVVNTIPIGGGTGSIWISPLNEALVADSNGANLYRYNAMDFSVLNSSANPLSSGGSEVCGSASFVATLQPNWGDNGTVKILHPDLSYWKQYTVGLYPTDIKVYASPSPIQDEVQMPGLVLSASPNPVQSGQLLKLKAPFSLHAELKIYNLKGELLTKENMNGSDIAFSTAGLANGCYFYKLSGTDSQSKSLFYTGKFVILK